MKLHQLKPAKGATQQGKSIGRGDGSGHGGTVNKRYKRTDKAGRVIKEKWHMKVARCQFSGAFPNADSIIFFV